MSIGANIKYLREQKGLLQKQMATELGMGYTNYNKLENGYREPSVTELQKMAKIFNITVDRIINMDGAVPQEIVLEDKSSIEQMNMIKQLEEEDKKAVFRIISTMITKNKFKEFFQKNVATL